MAGRVRLLRLILSAAQFPSDLAQHAEQNLGVLLSQMEAVDQAAQFFFGVHGFGGLEVTGVAQGLEHYRDDSLDLARGGRFRFRSRLDGLCGLGFARELVHADRHRLTEIHGAVVFARGDAHQPVAIAERFIREANFFGAEYERDGTGSELLEDDPRAFLQSPDGMVQFPVADGSGAHDQRTIGHGFGNGLEFFRACEHGGGAHGGARFAERDLVGIYDAQAKETEIAHGAGGGADIERVARAYQDDAQGVEFSSVVQGPLFYSRRCMVDESSD